MKNKKIEKNKKQEDRIVGRLKSRKIEKNEIQENQKDREG